MPDLGKYAFEVNSAYLVTFLLLAIIVLVYLRKNWKIKLLLAAAELRKDA